MPDTNANLTVDITGNTAAIATDYVNSSHFQVNKLAWGDTGAANRVTTSNPLPVDIRLATATIGITGSVGGLGNFKIINGLSGSTAIPLVISGTTNSSYAQVQINGNVQGTTNGVLLGITGNINILNGITIYGGSTFSLINPIGITGGRRLAFTTDSVSITGSTVSVSYMPPLNKNYDTVAVYNSAGGTYIPVMLRDGSGNSLGSSGGALNVNIIGAGITATISIGAVVGVSQSSPFYIAGATAGPEVRIVGTQGASKAIPVVIVTDAGALSNKVVVDGLVAVNLESVNTNILTLDSKLSSLISNTNNMYNSMISGGITGDPVQTKITSTTRPSTVYTGTRTLGLTFGNNITLTSQNLNTGITVKNKSAVDINIQGNGTTNNSYALSSGEILFIESNNLNNISFNVTAGSATFTYIAT
jgi:hypothetical protein